jgi:RHS repeat-associated protein
MLIQERSETFTTNGYRFAFNGKEQDNEVSGSGNSYDFGARIYDSRLGKFLSVDPDYSLYCWQSPYVFAAASPITFIDQDGRGPIIIIGSPEQTKKLKTALKNNNYYEIIRILAYASKMHFVDEKGEPSDYMPNKLLTEKGLVVMDNSALIDGGADLEGGIGLQGIEYNDDGSIQIVEIGRIVDPEERDLYSSIATNPKAIVDGYIRELKAAWADIVIVKGKIAETESEIARYENILKGYEAMIEKAKVNTMGNKIESGGIGEMAGLALSVDRVTGQFNKLKKQKTEQESKKASLEKKVDAMLGKTET